MSLIFNKEHDFIKYGGRLDSCMFCTKELAEKENISYSAAEIKVRGQLEGQKIIKFKKSGSDVVICKKHIEEMNRLLTEENKKTPPKKNKGDEK